MNSLIIYSETQTQQIKIVGMEVTSEVTISKSISAPAASLFQVGFCFYANGEIIDCNKESDFTTFYSEEALARIWNHPLEDEAWRNL